MVARGLGAVTVLLLIGLAGPAGEAWAQYYPAQRAYPPPPYRALPPVVDADDDDEPFYDPPMVHGRPLPPPGVPAQTVAPPPAQFGRPVPPASIEPYGPPPGPRYGTRAPVVAEEDSYVPPPPPGYIYREPVPAVPRGYEPVEPGARVGRPYGAPVAPEPPNLQPPPGPVIVPPPAPATVPPPGIAPAPIEPQEAFRPPAPIGPNQAVAPQDVTGATRGDPRTMMSALPPDYQPETGPRKELPPQFRRTMVDYRSKEPAGSIVIDTQNTYLYLILGKGKAMRYGVGVGREGFTWAGVEKVTKMAEWPDWNPPPEMIERQPYLPRFMAGGETNPLGARALYLGKTIYRIHGTNQPSTIGSFVSSGCIRLTNEDIIDLYTRVKVGTRVVVLPGRPPAQASAAPMPVAPQGAPPTALPPAGPSGHQVGASPLPPPPFVR
jgi:lipoprotein-anchoring transpeptidase ErfK/SrfK